MNLLDRFSEWQAIQREKPDPEMNFPRIVFIFIAAHVFWILFAYDLGLFMAWLGL